MAKELTQLVRCYLHNVKSLSLADYIVTTRSVGLAAAVVCMISSERAERVTPVYHWANVQVRVLGSETLLPAGVATAWLIPEMRIYSAGSYVTHARSLCHSQRPLTQVRSGTDDSGIKTISALSAGSFHVLCSHYDVHNLSRALQIHTYGCCAKWGSPESRLVLIDLDQLYPCHATHSRQSTCNSWSRLNRSGSGRDRVSTPAQVCCEAVMTCT